MHEHALPVLVGGHQCRVDEIAARAPGLGALEDPGAAVAGGDEGDARVRRLGRPHPEQSAGAGIGGGRLPVEVGEDRPGVVVGLEHLGHADIGAGELGQYTPARERVAPAWQRQHGMPRPEGADRGRQRRGLRRVVARSCSRRRSTHLVNHPPAPVRAPQIGWAAVAWV